MSYGLTPYDFVQQVFYAQEKVLLDFRPDDDKYKEVLIEANFVLQELQKEEDWTWLRESLVLGSVDDVPGGGQIPEFKLPEWVYKCSTRHDDCLRLVHRSRSNWDGYDLYEAIEVPFISAGRLQGSTLKQTQGPATNVPDRQLGCCVVSDNILTFNRPLTSYEKERIAVVDVQRRLPLFHICSDSCPRDEDGNCKLIEDRMLTEIPDPNYVVFRTAALHAEGSPPAQGRIQSLVDNAQKLLSAMRQNDASATDSDYLDWDEPGYINII